MRVRPITTEVRRRALLLAVLLGAACTTGSDPGPEAVLTPSVLGSPSPPVTVAGVVADLTAYWRRTFPQDVTKAPRVRTVDGDAKTRCGTAAQDEGSFYCDEDTTIYVQQVDLDDLADLPRVRREAAQVYLLAHEYGHAVQAFLDVDAGDDAKGLRSDSVRYELQADCLAGAYVATRGEATAAGAYERAVREGGDDVGEDPLPPAEYEHGTGAQRVSAFRTGRRAGPTSCGLPS